MYNNGQQLNVQSKQQRQVAGHSIYWQQAGDESRHHHVHKIVATFRSILLTFTSERSVCFYTFGYIIYLFLKISKMLYIQMVCTGVLENNIYSKKVAFGEKKR